MNFKMVIYDYFQGVIESLLFATEDDAMDACETFMRKSSSPDAFEAQVWTLCPDGWHMLSVGCLCDNDEIVFIDCFC